MARVEHLTDGEAVRPEDGPQRTPAKDGDMEWQELDTAERLVAEQAVLAYREVRKAVRGAPMGRGLELTERAVLAQGRRQMAVVMEEALKEAAGAEKGGSAASAAGVRRTATTRSSNW